ncbi:MAG: hypothetical protein AAF439_09545 [Pseudomonadota bacterium]
MTINKVMASIEAPGGQICVDIFQRPDGSFGFEEYRRDLEDGRGWQVIGHHADRRFDTREAAYATAQQLILWLKNECDSPANSGHQNGQTLP